MEAPAPTPESSRETSPESRPLFSAIGFGFALIALMIAIFATRYSTGPSVRASSETTRVESFENTPAEDESLGDKAKKLAKSGLKKLADKLLRDEPSKPRDSVHVDKTAIEVGIDKEPMEPLSIALFVAAALGILGGLLGFVRHEPQRMSSTAVTVGVVALAWKPLFWIAIVVIAVFVGIQILSELL